jgi:hypothetical protein
MGTEPHTQPGIREHRIKRADGGEPLNDELRQVQRIGNSIMIGLTDYGVQTHNVKKADTLRVAVYPDGIWIDTSGVGDE